MSIKDNSDDLNFAEKAFREFNEIMSNKHKDMFEDVNRVNRGELFVLHFLFMRNDSVLPSELSAALHASTARISALLGTLEKKGLIEREIDKSNRRNILVTITEEGRKRAEAEMKGIKERMIKVFTQMGKEDTEAFIRLHRQFSELLQKHLP